jgi:hypothetical protein
MYVTAIRASSCARRCTARSTWCCPLHATSRRARRGCRWARTAHFVARKSHSDKIAARGLRQRGGRSKLLFSCRRASQRLVRRRWQLLSSEQRPIRGVSATSFSASKVRSAADSPCSAGGMREASSSTRRHGWAGQSSPAVRGVLASATVDVGMVSSEASAAHQAPRPDLLYRSGGGAFKRL